MPIARRQLFEFNDLHVVPASVRDTVVESLAHALEWGRMLEGLVEPFERFLANHETRDVLDVGSGAGGPARILVREFQRSGRPTPRFVLTDLHPRVSVWSRLEAELPGAISYHPEPVDATRLERDLTQNRVCSIVNVLHHLPPALAQSVLVDSARNSRGVFVAECFERNPVHFARFAPAGLAALAANPFLSPRQRIAKALFTYLATPVALGVCVWDGIVSTLRVYTEAELRAMVAPAGAHLEWEYGTWEYPLGGKGYYFRSRVRG